MTPRTVIWEPSERQQALIACPVEEIFFGGARGGGKTEASIGDWLEHSAAYGENASGIFFRKTLKQLDQVKERTAQLYSKIGGKYNEQHSTWTMPGGAKLKLRYLEKDRDAEEYQGHSYTRVYMEELTNYPTPGPLNLMRATLRSSTGVPVGLRATGNPGGPGHHWVKARYITPNPAGWDIIRDTVMVRGEAKIVERVFIPSKVEDNPNLWKNDPFYVARLAQTGSEALVKAWLEGNWDVIDGAFFDCWDERKHVLSTSQWLHRIPPWAMRFRAFDWGSAKPFCVGWYAVSDGTWGLPARALVKYREWYGSTGKPDVGLRMTNDLIAKGILARDNHVQPDGSVLRENVSYCTADTQIFARSGGPSIADTMMAEGLSMQPADKNRIPGWTEMRRRLAGQIGESPDGEPIMLDRPLLYFLDCCKDSIRTIPILQHDETKPEDVDSDMEDHAGDETRYACMSYPWVEEKPEEEDPWHFPKRPDEMTINEIVERLTAKRKEAEEWA